MRRAAGRNGEIPPARTRRARAAAPMARRSTAHDVPGDRPPGGAELRRPALFRAGALRRRRGTSAGGGRGLGPGTPRGDEWGIRGVAGAEARGGRFVWNRLSNYSRLGGAVRCGCVRPSPLLIISIAPGARGFRAGRREQFLASGPRLRYAPSDSATSDR
jgi:hypothetical protein